MPASFIVKPPTPSPAKRTKRKATADHKATLHAPQLWQQPRMVRTSLDEPSRPRRHNADLQTDADQTITYRFVTAEFSSPYVAVPVANGWLLFQL
jgi:hypothetical protein